MEGRLRRMAQIVCADLDPCAEVKAEKEIIWLL